MDDLKYNGSGYRDVTAERAIRKTDKQPQEVTDLVEIFKKIADLQGYEIHGRIGFKNKHTGIIYSQSKSFRLERREKRKVRNQRKTACFAVFSTLSTDTR